jgi:hypothetical protein
MNIVAQVGAVMELEPDRPSRTDRSPVIRLIAQELLSQHDREEGLPLRRMQDLDLRGEGKKYLDAAAFIVNYTLSPDRAETAIFAMADIICSDGTEGRTILDYTARIQRHYYHLAIAAFNALQLNLRETPPDSHYREQLCRTLDAILPKELRW